MISKGSRSFDRSLIPPAPDLAFEETLWSGGFSVVAGLDEAGRGAWAGPVSAAAVILPRMDSVLSCLVGVRDSKEMTPTLRTQKAADIRSVCAGWGVGMASAAEIDQHGILPATRLAMQRALSQLDCPPQHLLIDFIRLPAVELPQMALVKGDARSLSIACASVLAKVARDAWMVGLEVELPGYGFASHKGYGTAVHRQSLALLGPSSEHRRSFAPVAASAHPSDGSTGAA